MRSRNLTGFRLHERSPRPPHADPAPESPRRKQPRSLWTISVPTSKTARLRSSSSTAGSTSSSRTCTAGSAGCAPHPSPARRKLWVLGRPMAENRKAADRWIDRRAAAALVTASYLPDDQTRDRTLADPRQDAQRQVHAARKGCARLRRSAAELGSPGRAAAPLKSGRRPGLNRSASKPFRQRKANTLPWRGNDVCAYI